MSAANAIGNALAGYPNNKTDNGTFFGKYALIIDHGIGMMSSFSLAKIKIKDKQFAHYVGQNCTEQQWVL